MSAKIGSLHVSLSAETSAFEAGMKKSAATAGVTAKKIEGSFAGIGAALKAGIAGFVGAISVGAIVQGARAALDYASSLKDVSEQLNVTTKDLQTLRYAASQTGVSQQQLETGLGQLSVTLGKVAAGAAAPTKAIEAIGLKAKDLAGLDTGDALRKISDGLLPITDRAQRAAVEVALFGEAGAKLDPLLANGSGALNELAQAAAELGIVLSDEQIQKADETADKLDAMKTVLAARIAGVVAENADSILALADALVQVASAAADAVRAMSAFYANAIKGAGNFTREHPVISRVLFGEKGVAFIQNSEHRAAQSEIVGRIRANQPKSRSIPQFLASAGRTPRTPRARKPGRGPRDRSEDVAFQVEQAQRQADMDILRAKQDLARDYVERTTLSIQMLDLERQGFLAEQDYKVKRAERDLAEGRINAQTLEQVRAGSEALKAKYDEADALKRRALLEEEQRQRVEDSNRLQLVDLEIQADALQAERQLATTATERRDIELRLLDLAYRQERARLMAIEADEKAGYAAQEDARRRLAALDGRYAADRQGVINATRDPLEEWGAQVPQTAAQITEAFQSIQANGLDGISDALTDIITGTKSLGEAFGEIANQIIADIIRMTIRMLIFRALSSFLGAGASTDFGGIASGLNSQVAPVNLPGLASGGFFPVGGRGGVDKNIVSVNGIPRVMASASEMVGVLPQGATPSGGMVGGRVEIVLKDDMLDARIVQGAAQVVLVREPATIQRARDTTMRSLGRRRLAG